MPFLDWVNKANAKTGAENVPYHLLEHVSQHGEASGNMLIQGDNLQALKALRPFYAGQVKCIFIDPPYNTQSAFEHYDDKLEHSLWLSTMYPRLELLRDLLADEGSIWITIDDNEAHYLKVMCDEVFGRDNFVANCVWQKKSSVQANAIWFSDSHDHVFCYAKNKEKWKPNLLSRTDEANARYSNVDNDPRGVWTSGPITISLTSGQRGAQFAKTGQSSNLYKIVTPNGREILPPQGTCWRYSEERLAELIADNRIYFGSTGGNVPRLKRFLHEVQDGITPTTLWSRDDVGDNHEAKRETVKLQLSEEVFATPKPERLIQRILHLATQYGDLVLDSFLGSGTTAAVAHKMNRRYIGIEMGEHAVTHCLPRLQKVIDGEQGGISQAVNWQGGGGFNFYRLGEAVFLPDGSINPAVKFNTLAGYIWHFETHTPSAKKFNQPLLGIHAERAYYLLYNGILGDRRPNGGNVLTRPLLQWLLSEYPHDGKKVIYGETSRISAERLAAMNIEFKQIPYDIKA